jgi:uncharacterized protein YecE (DUF72 family)
MAQLDLFPAPPLDTRADEALAARCPPHVRLGTSSWTFRGWAGLVYRGHPSQAELVERGLGEYARHPIFRTVGIDRSFYAPIMPTEYEAWARQLPDGFPCLMKVWSGFTSYLEPGGRGRNPKFLDAKRFRDAVLDPALRHFEAHLGPLLFQLLPLAPGQLPPPDAVAEKVDRFFQALPKGPTYAVELRNEELLTPTYLEVLARHGVSHVFNAWERMPTVSEQLALVPALPGAHVVCRLLLPQGVGYEAAREAFAPFDTLQAPDEGMRADVVALAQACERQGKQLTVIVNNKAEGSSPLTVRALLERLAR